MNRKNETERRRQTLAKYQELEQVLLDFVNELQVLEPGGTLVDSIELGDNKGSIRIAYTAEPLQVRIERNNREFVLKVVNFARAGQLTGDASTKPD